MKKSIVFFIFINFMFISPFLFSQNRYPENYKIGPRDLLEIRVSGLDELNQRVRVSDDGKISLPLIGEVEVFGYNKFQLEYKLKQILIEKQEQNPQISARINNSLNNRMSVLGVVSDPVIGRVEIVEISRSQLRNRLDQSLKGKHKQERQVRNLIKDFLRQDLPVSSPVKSPIIGEAIKSPLIGKVEVYVIEAGIDREASPYPDDVISISISLSPQKNGSSHLPSSSQVMIKKAEDQEQPEAMRVNVININSKR